jgi:hypothetical protein
MPEVQGDAGAHYSWENMDVRKIRLFKLMTIDFQQHIVSISTIIVTRKLTGLKNHLCGNVESLC